MLDFFKLNIAVTFRRGLLPLQHVKSNSQCSTPYTTDRLVLLPSDARQSTVLLRQVVRPSVTLRYRGHIGWNTSKIISWPI